MLTSVSLVTEAGPNAGIGHAMRSLWIAKALMEEGFYSVRVLIDAPELIEKLAEKWGVSIESTCSELGKSNLEASLDSILNHSVGLVIIDGVTFENEWVQRIRSAGIPVIQVSGSGGPSLDVDGCVWPEECPQINEKLCHFVCGERYLPLAPDYWGSPRRDRSATIRKVLVTFGGVDHYDATTSTIRVLEECILGEIEIRVIVGSFYDNLPKIREAAAKSRHCVEVAVQPMGLYEHLMWCDLVVCAAGTTLFEACATGTPSIGVAVWPIQKPALDRVSAAGATLAVEYLSATTFESGLRKRVLQLSQDPGNLRQLSVAGHSLVDGRGAERIASWLKTLI